MLRLSESKENTFSFAKREQYRGVTSNHAAKVQRFLLLLLNKSLHFLDYFNENDYLCGKYIAIMELINTDDMLLRAVERSSSDRSIITPDAVLVLGSGEIESSLLDRKEPFYFTEGRMLRIVEGLLTIKLNLEVYELQQHDILVIPPRSIVEPLQASGLYTEVLVLRGLSGLASGQQVTLLPHDIMHLQLSDADWRRQTSYFSLLADLMRQNETLAASHLIASMVHDLHHINKAHQQLESLQKLSRGQRAFHHFLRLANEHGYHERNIAYYASQLNITPNHLSAIVRQQSQRTVLSWLTERTLTEARILLRHSDLMIYEIAERLNFSEHSAFSLFFKKHTGMTPLEYREKRL